MMSEDTLYDRFLAAREQRTPHGTTNGTATGEGPLYQKAGVAHFYCPTLYELMGNRHHLDISEKEKQTLDGEGHMSWTFVWDAGAYHIDHPSNGSVPRCSCGKTLVFVKGDHPGHKENA